MWSKCDGGFWDEEVYSRQSMRAWPLPCLSFSYCGGDVLLHHALKAMQPATTLQTADGIAVCLMDYGFDAQPWLCLDVLKTPVKLLGKVSLSWPVSICSKISSVQVPLVFKTNKTFIKLCRIYFWGFLKYAVALIFRKKPWTHFNNKFNFIWLQLMSVEPLVPERKQSCSQDP